jgi:hypothetical protein
MNIEIGGAISPGKEMRFKAMHHLRSCWCSSQPCAIAAPTTRDLSPDSALGNPFRE